MKNFLSVNFQQARLAAAQAPQTLLPQQAPHLGFINQCRLPAFWRLNLDLWIGQAEAQIHLNRVTSDASRYNLLLTALDHDTIADVADIIRNQPTVNKYDRLKSVILGRLTESPDTQLHKLLTGLELGINAPRNSFAKCKCSQTTEWATMSFAYNGST